MARGACWPGCRKYKEARLKEDPTWTLEKELAQRRGVSGVCQGQADGAMLRCAMPRSALLRGTGQDVRCSLWLARH